MAADACGDFGLRMASFTNETVAKLRSYLPEEANIHNPVDVIGDAKADLLRIRHADGHGRSRVVAVLVLLLHRSRGHPRVAKMVASHTREQRQCLSPHAS
jgi:acyl-CoA synthetase (NDP forming)